VNGKFLQARWQQKLTPLFSYAVAIEEAPDLVIYPTVKKEDRDKQTLQLQKNIPAISAYARYEQEKLWHVQVSGLLRSLEYHNTGANTDSYIPTWGVNMGAALHLVPEKTTFKMQGVYGQGVGDYMADLGDLEKEANAVYIKKDDKSMLETLNAWGVSFGIAHQWLPKLCSEVAYRFLNTQHDQRSDDGAYKRGHFASVNLFYYPSEQIKIGTEYLFGAREDISGTLKDGHRVQAVVGFEL
jgi:DcaP outer membrane protein